MKKLIIMALISYGTIGVINATERVVLEDLTPAENKSSEVLPEYKILDDIKKANINAQIKSAPLKSVVINNNTTIKELDDNKEAKPIQKNEITVEQKKELINSIKKEIKEDSAMQEKNKEKPKEVKLINIKESESCFPGNKTIEGNNLKVIYLDNCVQLLIKGNNNNIQIKGSKNIIVEGNNNNVQVKENIENGVHILGSNNKLVTLRVNNIIVDGEKNVVKWKEDKKPRVRLIGVSNIAELNISN